MKLCFPEKILLQHAVVLGKTGAGKSSKLRHIVEHLLAQNKRVCIVDPKGDWWGLKKSADGNGPGLPVIAFGDFKEGKASDVPINAQSGKQIADLITSGNRPCIIGMRGWMPGALVKFWLDFAPALFNAQSGELYLVIDEVHNFAPKGKILDPEAGKCIHWTNRLMSEGRGLGLICFIASQRPQKVHNDTLTCCETLIAARVIHKADRDAVKDWIDGCGDGSKGKEVLDGLAQLNRPDAWVWSPEAEFGPKVITFPMFETFDSFAPPQLQKKISSEGWSTVNLDEVKAKLATVIEEQKANDPAELKRQVRELQKQLNAKTPGGKDAKVEPVIKEVSVLTDEDRQLLAGCTEELSRVNATCDGVVNEINRFQTNCRPQHLGKILQKLSAQPQRARMEKPFVSTAYRESAVRRPVPTHVLKHTNNVSTIGQSGTDITGTQQRILDVVLMLGVRGLVANREMVARWLDIHPNGGRYGSDLGALRANGLLDGFELTDAGVEAADGGMVTGLEGVRAVLEGTQLKIIGELTEGATHDREGLAAQLGIHPNGGRYGSDLGRLRTMGLIPERGTIKLLEAAFK